jgi:hypothetical protein
MLYTDDTSKFGLYPRGIQDYTDPNMLKVALQHPYNSSVEILEHSGPYPCIDKGHRDEWISFVKFADGLEHVFYIPCKPIEIRLDMEAFYQKVEKLTMQSPYQSSKDGVTKYAQEAVRAEEEGKIMDMLHKMNADETYFEEVLILTFQFICLTVYCSGESSTRVFRPMRINLLCIKILSPI